MQMQRTREKSNEDSRMLAITKVEADYRKSQAELNRTKYFITFIFVILEAIAIGFLAFF